VTIEIYRDTNKDTYVERHDFESLEDAHEWLTAQVEDAAPSTEAHTCQPEGDPADLRSGTLWTCPVDGRQWVSVKRMIGRRMLGEWRPRIPVAQ
jgi:hypothetical protein